MCAFYILRLQNYCNGSLADSSDLYSHGALLPGSQLCHREEDGGEQEDAGRPDRAGRVRQRGGELCRQIGEVSVLAEVSGGKEEEIAVKRF